MGGLKDAAINESKTILAFEVTKLIHGEDEAIKARGQAKSVFADRGGGGQDAPKVEISRATFGTGMPILDLLVAAKICDTKGEAKRLVEQGGISIDDVKVADFKFILAADKFSDGSGVVLRKGKKNFFKLTLS